MKLNNLILVLLFSLPNLVFSQANNQIKNINNQSVDTLVENNALRPFRTKNVKQAMFLNGSYSDQENGYLAYAKLNSEFNYDQFTLALNFYAIDFDGSHDTIIAGGITNRWFSLRMNKGILELSLNNHNKIYPLSSLLVESKKWNHVIISMDVQKKQIHVMLNGWSSETINLDHDFQFDVKHGNESDKFICFSDFSSGGVFYGFVTDIKVFNTHYNRTEMWLLFMADTTDLSAPDYFITKE